MIIDVKEEKEIVEIEVEDNDLDHIVNACQLRGVVLESLVGGETCTP